jgi:anti-sigma regulatory factor (Ser/Thr protein kinase)
MTLESTITLRSDVNEIETISSAILAAMESFAFSGEEILDTQLAVEEAVTNTIRHGYAGSPGTINIRMQISAECAEVEIDDRAPQFNPLLAPEPDITADIEERGIGGIGIYLIRKVMDKVSYRYEDGRNVLTLVKKRAK